MRKACGAVSPVTPEDHDDACSVGGQHLCMRIGEGGEHWGSHRCCWCVKSWANEEDEDE